MPSIRLENIVKNYGTGTNAVDRLNLTVEDGDFMCLLGPSGCGKSTTVRMIAGLESITAGSLSIGDQPVDSPERSLFVPPEKRDIGLVFQSYALWPHLSVAQNVDYGLKLRNRSREQRRRRVDEVTEKLGIGRYRDRYPSQLSGGQQQRVALARMLAVDPQIMLLDEPLSNLDSRLRLEMRAELKRIHGENETTVVFVTHDQWEAMTLATRVAVMYEGVLQQVGSPLDIYDRPVNRFVAGFLGVPPINFIDLEGEAEHVRAAREFLSGQVEDLARIGSLAFRPETAVLLPAEEAASAGGLVLPARFDAVMPTGGSWTVDVVSGGRHFYLTSLHRPPFTDADDVRVVVPPEKVHVFDIHENRAEVQGA
jgi:iron(III) transport system ATP-binding protein